MPIKMNKITDSANSNILKRLIPFCKVNKLNFILIQFI